MMTARVLALTHPDDRRETANRFGVPEDALRQTAVLISGMHEKGILSLAAALRERGLTSATAGAGDARDLLVAGPREAFAAGPGRVGGPAEPARVDEAVAALIRDALRRAETPPHALRAREHHLRMDRGPLLVGILNATPDSFHDAGRYYGLERAVARAEEMAAEGADIIEVGGETARPSVPVITAADEIDRVCPVIEAVRARLPVPIGIDTYKPDVARAALSAGASIVNDISGLADARMAGVAARAGAALVVTHIQGRPKVANPHARYERVVDEVYQFLARRLAQAEASGVPADALIVDPGLSFGKQAAHDVTLVRRLREFRGLGRPVYLAASRKNFIRDLLDLPFPELLEGTMAVVAYGVLEGANLIRTHDVRAMRRLVNMLCILLGPTPPTFPESGAGTSPAMRGS